MGSALSYFLLEINVYSSETPNSHLTEKALRMLYRKESKMWTLNAVIRGYIPEPGIQHIYMDTIRRNRGGNLRSSN